MGGSKKRQKWCGKKQAKVGKKGLPKPLNDGRGLGVVHAQTKKRLGVHVSARACAAFVVCWDCKAVAGMCLLSFFSGNASLLAGSGAFVMQPL